MASVLRRQRLVDLGSGHVDRLEHLDGEQLLARRPLRFRLRRGAIDRVGEARLDLLELAAVSRCGFSMRGDLRSQLVAAWR